ncbi:hypothetical protein ACL03H_15720 [Saccharopolyspora sp. MS10]|uniref:hypothetical protein n=1 Tax=Saccharopolyspora sp. MS10 TaxID=3385973 RepID=UPI0039A2B2EE
MLADHGARAALEELATTLPCPVRFGGDLGPRPPEDVESGFHRAVASVLSLLAESVRGADAALVVEFGHDEALHARVVSTAVALSTSELRASLEADAERIAAVGGAIESAVVGGAAIVTVSLGGAPAQAVPAWSQGSALNRRLLDLVRQGRRAFAEESEQQRWEAVRERLTSPPRLAVVSDLPADPDAVSRASELGVAVVIAEDPADEALAEHFLSEDDPHGSIDAVLVDARPDLGFLAALRRSGQRVEVVQDSTVDEAARELLALAPVIAARRALVSLRGLVRGLSGEHPLRWAVDQLATEAHEVTELDLLDEIRAGEIRLREELVEDAARLLGACGPDPRARLGLDAADEDEQVRAAAEDAVLRWRAEAGGPGLVGRNAMTCEVLVRTAEGLLDATRTA